MVEVGDKVQVTISKSHNTYKRDCHDVVIGKVMAIKDYGDGKPVAQVKVKHEHLLGAWDSKLKLEKTEGGWWYATDVKVVSDERLAIDLLKSLGYEVVEPKPKLSGKVYVYRSTDGREQLSATTKSGYDSYYWELISIVDWTEGQGLESSTEVTEPDGSF